MEVTNDSGHLDQPTRNGGVNSGNDADHSASLAGDIAGDIGGDIAGDIAGDITGDIAGDIAGDIRHQIRPFKRPRISISSLNFTADSTQQITDCYGCAWQGELSEFVTHLKEANCASLLECKESEKFDVSFRHLQIGEDDYVVILLDGKSLFRCGLVNEDFGLWFSVRYLGTITPPADTLATPTVPQTSPDTLPVTKPLFRYSFEFKMKKTVLGSTERSCSAYHLVVENDIPGEEEFKFGEWVLLVTEEFVNTVGLESTVPDKTVVKLAIIKKN